MAAFVIFICSNAEPCFSNETRPHLSGFNDRLPFEASLLFSMHNATGHV